MSTQKPADAAAARAETPPVPAAPVTATPVTAAPVTAPPVTAAPVTVTPVPAPSITAAPVTAPPAAVAPDTEVPAPVGPATATPAAVAPAVVVAPAAGGPDADRVHAVGLAVGRGTGAEIAAVFERVLDRCARLHGRSVAVERSPRTYHSYISLRDCLRDEGGGTEEIRRRTHEDAGHYEEFVRDRAAAGTGVIFRTAVNAQTLYLVRQRLHAVKVDTLDAAGARLLLVRDQAQGFYTGDNEHLPGRVRRATEFSRDITEKVLSYALSRARQEWPGEGPARIVMAYKFHLLDGALDEWAGDFAAEHGVDIQVCQPDTVNRNLITHGPADRTVLVAGNEWADIMHVVLLDRFGAGRQEDHCTRNVHLHPDVRGLVEYQTVHGSADDLEGRDLVNPVATVRAAAAIAERYAECEGAVAEVEAALALIRKEGIRTPDLGGRHSTTQVVDALLDALRPSAGGVPAARPGERTATARTPVPTTAAGRP